MGSGQAPISIGVHTRLVSGTLYRASAKLITGVKYDGW